MQASTAAVYLYSAVYMQASTAAVYLYSAVYMQASTAAVYLYSAVYMQASTAAMTSSGRGLVAAPVFHACCGMSTYVYVRVCIDVCICAGTFTWTLT
jgi:hypothetical protein